MQTRRRSCSPLSAAGADEPMTPAARRLYDYLLVAAPSDAPGLVFLDPRGHARTWRRTELFAEAERIAERLSVSCQPGSGLVAILASSHQEQVLHYLAALA